MLKDLKELLQIPSVEDMATATKEMPFGHECHLALEWFLRKAAEYGLKTGNVDGYAGYAEIGHPKGKLIGVLCHLDVVPAGDGWTYPAYDLTEKDGHLYGRGVVDNKGAAIVFLHLFKEMVKKGEDKKLKNRYRLIVGMNEETGSACMHYYVKNAEIPAFSLVPDADFPLVSSEKGILQLKVSFVMPECCKKNIKSLKAGDRANVVPDRCSVVLQNELAFETTGIAGHAKSPHKADNAIFKAVDLLKEKFPKCDLLEVLGLFNLDATQNFGIDEFCPLSGKTTLNFACIDYQDGDKNLDITLDIRMPKTLTKKEVIAHIQKKLDEYKNVFSSKITELAFQEHLCVDLNSSYIKALIKAYQETTGDFDTPPRQTGGGTYARRMPNAVAFGTTFPNQETNIHNIDEGTSLKEFEKLSGIYMRAIEELEKIK
ncbi:MAG: Sapep family Mn(2+)-dependent dipeptidase [Firmicutes bacterium]|nr:Sapep family Mn(2+)-dependent dipeptidase [Bacillota bacterium]